jgi:hypothetical protein
MSRVHFPREQRRALIVTLCVLAGLAMIVQSAPTSGQIKETGSYLGFDRNDYPGDENLRPLRKTFAFTGYWLNSPPGARTNSWIGKRKVVEDAGFGFLVLFNGRTYAEIRAAGDPSKVGAADGAKAARTARSEGFPLHTVIFLDQEQGGRLLPEQRNYMHAWIDAVASGNFSAGIYCSGIAAREDSGDSVITAEDIRQHAGGRKIIYWVVNDSCPPSPGCTVSKPDSARVSGISFADIWQYAQSPWRKDFARSCRSTYGKDGNCYPASINASKNLPVDLNVAGSEDPSHGRSH